MTALLRPARTTDAGAVGAILSEFIDTTDWMPRVHTRAQDLAHAAMLIERGWVTVADAGHVVGFIARDGAEIHALYITGPSRGRGVGARVRSAALARPSRLGLWTFAANDRAQRFYERAGFRPAGGTQGDNDEGLPDIRYLWERPAP
ncbi:N-acetyltransferase family protein [Citreimonas sp.]|uniref:N-acetyltransferase family protein n=1 Tax=Citreimonas sp. TaxID=3036715 RepID=UPI0040594D21